MGTQSRSRDSELTNQTAKESHDKEDIKQKSKYKKIGAGIDPDYNLFDVFLILMFYSKTKTFDCCIVFFFHYSYKGLSFS